MSVRVVDIPYIPPPMRYARGGGGAQFSFGNSDGEVLQMLAALVPLVASQNQLGENARQFDQQIAQRRIEFADEKALKERELDLQAQDNRSADRARRQGNRIARKGLQTERQAARRDTQIARKGLNLQRRQLQQDAKFNNLMANRNAAQAVASILGPRGQAAIEIIGGEVDAQRDEAVGAFNRGASKATEITSPIDLAASRLMDENNIIKTSVADQLPKILARVEQDYATTAERISNSAASPEEKRLQLQGLTGTYRDKISRLRRMVVDSEQLSPSNSGRASGILRTLEPLEQKFATDRAQYAVDPNDRLTALNRQFAQEKRERQIGVMSEVTGSGVADAILSGDISDVDLPGISKLVGQRRARVQQGASGETASFGPVRFDADQAPAQRTFADLASDYAQRASENPGYLGAFANQLGRGAANVFDFIGKEGRGLIEVLATGQGANSRAIDRPLFDANEQQLFDLMDRKRREQR